MNPIVLVLALCIGFAFSDLLNEKSIRLQFDAWRAKHMKAYDSTEELELRFENFVASLQRVQRLQQDSPHATYGLTKFSDLSTEEFETLYLTARQNTAPIPDDLLADVPRMGKKKPMTSAFDWRSSGAITPVKDQGQCGSCWAHSTVEEIESMWFLSNNVLPILAPQQIVDCDYFILDEACHGGTTQFAYFYVKEAGGLETEENYPYESGDTGERGTCEFNESLAVATVQGFNYATPMCLDLWCNNQDELQLQESLLNAPVSICLNAHVWQDYVSGILSDVECGHALFDTDHCVQLVGYNQTTSPPYWIVRNSWGLGWGEQGYIYLEIANNTCGVANMATQVVV